MAARLNVLAPGQRIAIVFGPERTGLTNEHLQHCQWQIRIPSAPEFPSLNLAHAVAILAYELSQGLSAPPAKRSSRLAELGQIEAFSRDLEGCLSEIQFLKEQNPREIMMTLRQMLARASPDDRDIRILRESCGSGSGTPGQRATPAGMRVDRIGNRPPDFSLGDALLLKVWRYSGKASAYRKGSTKPPLRQRGVHTTPGTGLASFG